ncbi:MAG TPA: hypothetical protein PKD83_10200 [Ignavibacteria bacterium]|nr:hypothetical protein [Ignavibacteria bacterium]
MGAFTWANFIYLGILLILFPVNFKPQFEDNSSDDLNIKKRWFIFLIPLPFLLKALFHLRIFLNGGRLPFIETEIFNSLAYISAVLNYIILVYFFLVYLPADMILKDYFKLIKNTILAIKPLNILISFVILLTAFLIQSTLSNDLYRENSITKMLYLISLYGTTKPLVYIVLYINYFGPVFIILFFFIKYYKKYLLKLGFGIYIFFIVSIFIVFASEPRMNINFIPFFLLPSILVLKEFNISHLIFILLTVFSFILSKIYIPMHNMPDTNPDKNTLYNQIMYMNYFTISKYSYIVLFVTISVMSIMVVYYLKKSKKEISKQN